MDELSEAQFATWVRREAQRLGWCGVHVRYARGVVEGVHTEALDGHNDAQGFPDWLFIRGSQALFRELKTDVGRLRPAQRQWFLRLELAGLDVAVWRPSDRALIQRTLRAEPR